MWEYEASENPPASANFLWPNKFSRHIGDKAFGLVLADVIGFLRPKDDGHCPTRRSICFWAANRLAGGLDLELVRLSKSLVASRL